MRLFRVVLVAAVALMIFSQPVVAAEEPELVCFPHICG